MPNAIGTTPGTLIAQRMLETLLEEFPFLTLISSDFSSEASLLNQPVKVQIPDPLTAGDYTGELGYAPHDVSMQEIDLTINKHKHVTYGFNDTERSSTSVLLVERFARNGAHALGKAMMDDLMALVVAANFANYSLRGGALFSEEDLIDARAKLNGRKIPRVGRFAILGSDYYKGLAKASTLVANPGSPAPTVRTGDIGDAFGFDTSEYAFLDDNDEYLAGFCGVPEGLVIATRLPTMPNSKALGGGSVEVVREPNTGLSLQVRSWYDFRMGKEYRTYTLMYGVAPGIADCIERLVTQAPQ